MLDLAGLPPSHRKLVGEIAHLRLCLALENVLAGVCGRILCGAHYLDGSPPLLLASPTRSVSAAFSLMKTYNRGSKQMLRLRWSKTKDIRRNLSTTLSPSDDFFRRLSPYGSLLTEMRQVRNHVAHGSESTAREFRKAVRAKYGALKRGMTPGLFLLSTATSPRSKLEEHLISARVLVKEIVRA